MTTHYLRAPVPRPRTRIKSDARTCPSCRRVLFPKAGAWPWHKRADGGDWCGRSDKAVKP